MAIRIIKAKKRKPGQRAGLTRRIVALAAAEQIEKCAPQALSLRQLARTLGVAPMSISSHFKGGLIEIEDEIIRTVLAEVAPPFAPNQEPEAYIEGLFFSTLKALEGRPAIAMLAVSRLTSDPFIALMLAERSLASLVALGVAPEKTAIAYRMTLQAIFALILSGPARSLQPPPNEDAHPHSTLPESEYPHVSKFREAVLKDLAAAAFWKPEPKLLKVAVQELVEKICVV